MTRRLRTNSRHVSAMTGEGPASGRSGPSSSRSSRPSGARIRRYRARVPSGAQGSTAVSRTSSTTAFSWSIPGTPSPCRQSSSSAGIPSGTIEISPDRSSNAIRARVISSGWQTRCPPCFHPRTPWPHTSSCVASSARIRCRSRNSVSYRRRAAIASRAASAQGVHTCSRHSSKAARTRTAAGSSSVRALTRQARSSGISGATYGSSRTTSRNGSRSSPGRPGGSGRATLPTRSHASPAAAPARTAGWAGRSPGDTATS
ncbi:hypothetical protein [Actinomadura madurae]|uniref:hypothetical protein n=2 Tax=Actinomadura madurae TaxID=1993 RepID=UPI0020D23473|nr:hypothetical protein [Actinomadura madurae]MCP9948716.1 hypothetical protein [Actinomadura madurae]MCP9965489.1 hypothetical protein [Actinomadura madurae]MCP9977976.1 hypothetical protein [Actinomadura madurae]